MAYFDIKLEDISSNIESIQGYAESMGDFITRTEQIMCKLKVGDDTFAYLRSQLCELIEKMAEEREQLETIGKALDEASLLYQKTEMKLTGKDQDALAGALKDIEDLRDDEIYKILKSLMVRGILAEGDLEALKEILTGGYITSKRINGEVYLALKNAGITNAECAKWLEDHLGGKWGDYLARRLRRGDLGVYNNSGLTRNSRFFMDTDDPRIATYLKDLEDGAGINWKTFKGTFKPLDDFNYKGFGELSKLGKASKVLGTVGTVLSTGTDIYDNFYDNSTGEWKCTPSSIVHCVTDVGIDLGAGAGATALGATVGSAIVPPVGTVVGAGVGMLTDVVVNADFFDFNGDGTNDSIVDGVKMGAKYLTDKVGDFLGDLF